MKNTTPLIILCLVAIIVALIYMLVAVSIEEKKPPAHIKNTSQLSYEWKLVTSWPKNFPGVGEAPEIFAKKVYKMSNGRLDIKVYGSGEIVPALGVFDAVSQGVVHMGHTASYYYKGKIPSSIFFTTVPFGMNAQEFSAWITQAGGQDLWNETYKPFNIKPLLGGSTGMQMAGWFNKKINSLKDIQGLKMRIPGAGGEVFSRAGGVAETLPATEIYTALDTGVIDAVEWVGPFNDTIFGFPNIAKYYYYPGWHEPGSNLEFQINLDAWKSLPADLQEIVIVAAEATNHWLLNLYTAKNATSLETLKIKHDIVPKELSLGILSNFKRHSKNYYKEQAKLSPNFAKIYKSYNSFLTKVKRWHDVSERSYYETR